MQALTRPRYFMPVHGEYRHLAANRELAIDMGMQDRDIFISEIGKVLEIDRKGAKFNGTVPAGNVLVDGSGVGDIGSVVLRDRKHLSEDGLVMVVATVDMHSGYLVSGPDIISRGFVYVKESEELMDEARKVAETSLGEALMRKHIDRQQIKGAMRDELAKFIYKKTKRKPMIIPVLMEL